MPPALPLTRRLSTAALFPLGVTLTSWNYLWRTTPFHRRELLGSPRRDLPPSLPDGLLDDDLLLPEHGVGPLFHRVYRARIRETEVEPEALLDRLKPDLNAVTPTELARFFKTAGAPGALELRDEYLVRMPGPWDGPVRVVDVTPTSFRLATLVGHLEAGQIEFRARCDDLLVFEIESWARSGDRLSNLLYHRLRMAKEVQLHMWTSFLEGVARLAEGRLTGGVEIVTRRVETVARPDARVLGDPGASAALDDLHERPLNFEPPLPGREEDGWEVDHYRRRLPPEEPGPPAEGGSWEAARRLLRGYEFADPAIVRAVYRRDAPLEGRVMLLELRFLGLRFHAGVRVAGVRDETRTVDGREVRIWGWSYRTLQGHLEMGQMDYEVWKWLDTGEVEFRIARFSRPAEIRNPIVRLGFRVFGRREQIRFAHQACERMVRLVAAELGTPGADEDVVRASEALLVEEPRPARRPAS